MRVHDENTLDNELADKAHIGADDDGVEEENKHNAIMTEDADQATSNNMSGRAEYLETSNTVRLCTSPPLLTSVTLITMILKFLNNL